MDRIRFLGLCVLWSDGPFRFPNHWLTCGRCLRLRNPLVEEHEGGGAFHSHRLETNFLDRIITDPQPTISRLLPVIVTVVNTDGPILRTSLASAVQGARDRWRREAGWSSTDGSRFPSVADVVTERMLPIVTDHSGELVQY